MIRQQLDSFDGLQRGVGGYLKVCRALRRSSVRIVAKAAKEVSHAISVFRRNRGQDGHVPVGGSGMFPVVPPRPDIEEWFRDVAAHIQLQHPACARLRQVTGQPAERFHST